MKPLVDLVLAILATGLALGIVASAATMALSVVVSVL